MERLKRHRQHQTQQQRAETPTSSKRAAPDRQLKGKRKSQRLIIRDTVTAKAAKASARPAAAESKRKSNSLSTRIPPCSSNDGDDRENDECDNECDSGEEYREIASRCRGNSQKQVQCPTRLKLPPKEPTKIVVQPIHLPDKEAPHIHWRATPYSLEAANSLGTKKAAHASDTARTRRKAEVLEAVMQQANGQKISASSQFNPAKQLGPGKRCLDKDSIFTAEEYSASYFSNFGRKEPVPLCLPKRQSPAIATELTQAVEGHETSSQAVLTEASAVEMLQTASKAKTTQIQHALAQVPKNAKGLKTCPFCDEPMPKRPTTELTELMQARLDHLHQRNRSRATDTVETCAKHRQEYEVIPRGREQGWPSMLDAEKLEKRLQQPESTFRSSMEQVLAHPETSVFMQQAKRQRAEIGRKPSLNPLSAQLVRVQAGYYGEIGWEVFRSVLIQWFMSDSSAAPHNLTSRDALNRIVPFGALEFIDMVLIPELACHVIIDDYASCRGRRRRELTWDEAMAVKQASSPYGVAMFPSVLEHPPIGLSQPTSTASSKWPASFHVRSQQRSPSRSQHARTLAHPSSSAPIPSRPKPRAPVTISQQCRQASPAHVSPTSSRQLLDGLYHEGTAGDSPMPSGRVPMRKPVRLPTREPDDSDSDFFLSHSAPIAQGHEISKRKQNDLSNLSTPLSSPDFESDDLSTMISTFKNTRTLLPHRRFSDEFNNIDISLDTPQGTSRPHSLPFRKAHNGTEGLQAESSSSLSSPPPPSICTPLRVSPVPRFLQCAETHCSSTPGSFTSGPVPSKTGIAPDIIGQATLRQLQPSSADCSFPPLLSVADIKMQILTQNPHRGVANPFKSSLDQQSAQRSREGRSDVASDSQDDSSTGERGARARSHKRSDDFLVVQKDNRLMNASLTKPLALSTSQQGWQLGSLSAGTRAPIYVDVDVNDDDGDKDNMKSSGVSSH